MCLAPREREREEERRTYIILHNNYYLWSPLLKPNSLIMFLDRVLPAVLPLPPVAPGDICCLLFISYHTHTHTHTHRQESVHGPLHTYIKTGKAHGMYMHVYTHTHRQESVHGPLHTYIKTGKAHGMYMHMYTHTHTHTHTHRQESVHGPLHTYIKTGKAHGMYMHVYTHTEHTRMSHTHTHTEFLHGLIHVSIHTYVCTLTAANVIGGVFCRRSSAPMCVGDGATDDWARTWSTTCFLSMDPEAPCTHTHTHTHMSGVIPHTLAK